MTGQDIMPFAGKWHDPLFWQGTFPRTCTCLLMPRQVVDDVGP